MSHDQKSTKSIGELAALVVARSALTTATRNWKTIFDGPDWRIAWDSRENELMLVHHTSLTFSVVELTGTMIHRITVFSTTRERELRTDEANGHWSRVHGLRARAAVERLLPDG